VANEGIQSSFAHTRPIHGRTGTNFHVEDLTAVVIRDDDAHAHDERQVSDQTVMGGMRKKPRVSQAVLERDGNCSPGEFRFVGMTVERNLNPLSCFTFFTKQSGKTIRNVMAIDTMLTPSCMRYDGVREETRETRETREEGTSRILRSCISDGMKESIFLEMKME